MALTNGAARWKRGLQIGVAMAALAFAGGALAQANPDAPVTTASEPPAAPVDPIQARIQALEDEVNALQAQISDLKAATSANFKDVRDQASSQTAVTLPNGRPSLASADARFTANLHSVIQFDAANYFQREPGPTSVDLRRGGAAGDTAHARDLNSGTNFRRARLGMDGKVFGDFDYNVLLDFGGGGGAEDAGRIQELWLQYSGWKPWHFRIGAFAPLEGLEDANSTNGMPFLERPAPVDVARGLAGGDYRTGAQAWANGDHWLVSGAVTGNLVSTINSTGSATGQNFDEQLGLVGRLAATPLHGADWLVHVGVNGSYVARVADAAGPDTAAGRYTIQFRERPELRVDGTRLVDASAIEAKHAYTGGLELAAQKKNFYIEGEAFRYGLERRNSLLPDPHFSGFYVEGSWILTGETRRYNPATASFDAPPVTNGFNGKDKWGALEAALRYSDLDLNYDQGSQAAATPADGVRGGEQKIWTAGLNWYLNPVVRFMLDFQDVTIERLSPNAVTFLTPVGAQVGQHYHAVALRSQLAF